MGASYERIMQCMKKDEEIVRKITELTKGEQILWEVALYKNRTYRAEYKGMQIELSGYCYRLEIDNYIIQGNIGEVSSLLEELASAIQYWFPRSEASTKQGPLERAKEILDRLDN